MTLVELTASNLEQYACCGAKDPKHEGRLRKNRWLKTAFRKGLHAKVALTPDNRQCGYIEYLPGEHAWRGVEAAGYLFIHCVWIHYKEFQHRGVASSMVQAAVDDARLAGMHGVAVVARDGPWLAGSALFLKNGFTVADEAAPDYRLLVKKLDPAAPDPKFSGGWEKNLRKYGKGLTILCADQCPYTVKFAREIAEAARGEYALAPRLVELKTAAAARRAPTPYTVFAIVYNGRLLADHQISCTRFRNIMKKEFAAPTGSAGGSRRPRSKPGR